MICGVDEAGRGPVIGPLVIAGIRIKSEDKLIELKVRDSKKCTPRRRERLAKEIVKLAEGYELILLQPQEIDDLRKKLTLNEIELDHFAKIMKKLRADTYYVDSVDVKEERFAEELKKRLPFKAEIISKHNYQNLITAHQLNDKLEWFLMQLTKGAGVVEILGYEKIEQRENYKLIRPLINTTKEELLEFLNTTVIQEYSEKHKFCLNKAIH